MTADHHRRLPKHDHADNHEPFHGAIRNVPFSGGLFYNRYAVRRWHIGKRLSAFDVAFLDTNGWKRCYGPSASLAMALLTKPVASSEKGDAGAVLNG